MRDAHSSHLGRWFAWRIGAVVVLLLCAAIVSYAASYSPKPFASAEVRFTDVAANGLAIVPASCPSNPFDTSAPYGCSGTSPLCADGITPAPNNSLAQCTCQGGNLSACSAGTTCSVGYTFTTRGGYSAGVVGGCVFTGCPVGYTQGTDQNGNPSCQFVGCPSGYIQNGTSCVQNQQNQCIQGYVCGAGGNLYLENASCNKTLAQTCSYGCASNACFVPSSQANITAIPTIVKSGETTEVSWNAANVQSCTITGTNGDSWSCSGNACAASTTEQSSAIQAQTIYTLSCTGLDSSSLGGSATVDLVPTFKEK